MLKQKRLCLTFFTLTLLLFSSICLAELNLETDVWNVLEKDGRPIGFNYIQHSLNKVGYSYEFDQTLQMEFLNNPVEITQHMEVQFDQDYFVKHYEFNTKTDGVDTKIVAEFADGEVNVSVIDATGTEHKSFWKLDEPLYFDDSYKRYIFTTKNVKVGQEYNAKCWDIVQNKPKDVKFYIDEVVVFEYNGKSIPGFKIRSVDAQGEYISIVDWDGNEYRGESPSAGLTMQRVEKDQIPQLEAMAMDVLIVPANILVSHPYRSTESQITVKWNNVSADEFNWEDNRQSLVEYKETAGGHEVLVDIQKDDRDFTDKVSLPITEEDLAKYLKDTDYIHATLPEVNELVNEIIGDEKDGWVVTQKLVEWVYDYINFEAIVQTLNTEQILERKSGKCAEFSVLFASLARSAGIPTRVALGERYDGNSWIGHLWNEVWLGEWIAVDASHNQVAPDALLLKFVDSDTVMGTQIVRRGLIGQLDIIIENVLVPTTVDEESEVLQTGIDGQTYTNADFRCRITGPEGWDLIETSDQGIPMLVMQPADQPIAQGIMIMFNVPVGTTSEQILQSRLSILQNSLPEFNIVKQGNSVLGNEPISFITYTINYQGNLLRQQNWVLVHDDLCYIFVFGVADVLWGDYEAKFQQMLGSFEIID